jgi:transposase-like protein
MGQEDKKAEVVLEYLKGGVTLRGLEKKHGINFRQIHRWVKEYEGAKGPEGEEKGA